MSSRSLHVFLILCLIVPCLMARAQQMPVLTTLHTFDGKYGADISSTLTRGPDGNFYGVTDDGGLHNGTVFSISPTRRFTTLFRFNGVNGSAPFGQLVLGHDGAYYGTTRAGGKSNSGILFRITPKGVLTTLYAFSARTGGDGNADGAYPQGGMIFGSDGALYGTTFSGGASDRGVIYRWTASSGLSVLHTFTGPDGAAPEASLVQGRDDALYGTASQGGTQNVGVVFRITQDGHYTRLHSFDGPHGAYPTAGLTLGSDGAWYGATMLGGKGWKGAGLVNPQGYGTLFRMMSNGTFMTLHRFAADGKGREPFSGLTLGPDGAFYGATVGDGFAYEGMPDVGTVFRLDSNGVLSTLHTFARDEHGFSPVGVAFGENNTVYGTTEAGGVGHKPYGTVFRLVLP